MKLKLTINYRAPSQNVTKRQHWTEQYREKKKCWAALHSAIATSASDPSISKTLLERLKTALTAFAAADCFLVTIPRKSPSSSNNVGLRILPKNESNSK